MKKMHGELRTVFALMMLVVLLRPASAVADQQGFAFFEQKIRPVLVEHCYSCHSEKAQADHKLKGGLLLDSREASLRGGDIGPAVVPGQADKSLLLTAMKYDDPDLQMPPKKKLPAAVIADFERWIAMGAPDPRDGESAAKPVTIDFDAAKSHWAYQPLGKPAVPRLKDAQDARVITPIDAFLLERMSKAGVVPAEPADPRTLIRRVYLDLTGLPPTIDEVEVFVKEWAAEKRESGIAAKREIGKSDAAHVATPDSYSRVVDRLLASPRYGERWGRHWLDVARFAETQGYERDENKPFAWRYRDWVIDAFNSDMNYLRFVEEQIAGEELENSTVSSRIATGFLRVGTFDTIAADGRMAKYDNLDDTLGVTMSAFFGMTIQCARCHDHKFEPLLQADYFRLLSVFEPLPDPRQAVDVGGVAERAAYEEELTQWEKSFARKMGPLDALRIAALEKADIEELEKQKIRIDAKQRDEALAAYRTAADKRDKKQRDLTSLDGGKRFDDIIRKTGSDEQKREVDKLYREFKQQFDQDKPQPLLALAAAENKGAVPIAAKRLPAVPAPGDGEAAKNWPSMKLMIRGEVNRPGDEVPMGVPHLLASMSDDSLPALEPMEGSSGRRLWLARWMTQAQQPLLARVIVNRVWQQHFGRGFVPNANELGVAGGEPSHPELLEWLAADFVEHGWQLKHLHRMIVTSAMYQLAAQHAEPEKDVEAALYSRWKTRRLEAEAIRDSILAVSGKLNDKMHGPSIHPPFDGKIAGASAAGGWQQSDEREASRRSVYIYAKRAIPLPELETLGSPDSSVSMPQRAVATTSVQALLLLNGPLVAEQARHLAARLKHEAGDDPRQQVNRLWLVTLSRAPREAELEAALAYLAQHPRAKEVDKAGVSAAMVSLCQVVMNTNEFVFLN